MNKKFWIWNAFGSLFLAVMALIYQVHWLAYLGWFASALLCWFLHIIEICFERND